MRKFLDPSFHREFGLHPPVKETLPKIDVRLYRARKLPPRVALLSSIPVPAADGAAPVAGARETLHLSKSPQPRAVRDQVQTQLWKTSVKDWLKVHDVKSAAADWELPKADERVLLEWFDAIDIDRSGSVDADEILALLASNQIACSPARLEALFLSVNKRVDESLTLHDFVKLMHIGGAAALFLRSFKPKSLAHGGRAGGFGRKGSDAGTSDRSSAAATTGPDGGGGGEQSESTTSLAECRSDGDLAVLTYRRQRVLKDLQVPAKRHAFADRESFLKKYAPGALPAYMDRWEQRTSENPEEPVGLTDAEERMAGDGTFFKHQLEAAKEEERRVAARLAAEKERAKAKAEAEEMRRLRESISLPKVNSGTAAKTSVSAASSATSHDPRRQWNRAVTTVRAVNAFVDEPRRSSLTQMPRTVSLPNLKDKRRKRLYESNSEAKIP